MKYVLLMLTIALSSNSAFGMNGVVQHDMFNMDLMRPGKTPQENGLTLAAQQITYAEIASRNANANRYATDLSLKEQLDDAQKRLTECGTMKDKRAKDVRKKQRKLQEAEVEYAKQAAVVDSLINLIKQRQLSQAEQEQDALKIKSEALQKKIDALRAQLPQVHTFQTTSSEDQRIRPDSPCSETEFVTQWNQQVDPAASQTTLTKSDSQVVEAAEQEITASLNQSTTHIAEALNVPTPIMLTPTAVTATPMVVETKTHITVESLTANNAPASSEPQTIPAAPEIPTNVSPAEIFTTSEKQTAPVTDAATTQIATSDEIPQAGEEFTTIENEESSTLNEPNEADDIVKVDGLVEEQAVNMTTQQDNTAATSAQPIANAQQQGQASKTEPTPQVATIPAASETSSGWSFLQSLNIFGS